MHCQIIEIQRKESEPIFSLRLHFFTTICYKFSLASNKRAFTLFNENRDMIHFIIPIIVDVFDTFRISFMIIKHVNIIQDKFK